MATVKQCDRCKEIITSLPYTLKIETPLCYEQGDDFQPPENYDLCSTCYKKVFEILISEEAKTLGGGKRDFPLYPFD